MLMTKDGCGFMNCTTPLEISQARAKGWSESVQEKKAPAKKARAKKAKK